jgi:hypothetical protein
MKKNNFTKTPCSVKKRIYINDNDLHLPLMIWFCILMVLKKKGGGGVTTQKQDKWGWLMMQKNVWCNLSKLNVATNPDGHTNIWQ